MPCASPASAATAEVSNYPFRKASAGTVPAEAVHFHTEKGTSIVSKVRKQDWCKCLGSGTRAFGPRVWKEPGGKVRHTLCDWCKVYIRVTPAGLLVNHGAFKPAVPQDGVDRGDQL